MMYVLGGGAPKPLNEIERMIIEEVLTLDNPSLIGVPGGRERYNFVTSFKH